MNDMPKTDLPPLPRSRFNAIDRAVRAQYPDLPIIDGSGIDNWKKCRRKAYLTNHPPFGKGLRPLQAALPLEFGTIFHNALDLVYSEHPHRYDRASVWFRQMFNKRIEEIVKAINPFPSEVTVLEEARDLGMAMLSEWATWAPERDDFDVVATEAPMLIPIKVPAHVPFTERLSTPFVHPVGEGDPLTGEGVAVVALYYMRVDGLVKDNRGRLFLREYKTTDRWWPGYYLDIAQQVTRYCWGIKQRYGEAPYGVLYDFFAKHAIIDPPILKNGRPTSDMRKLAYVTAKRYRKKLEELGGGVGKEHDVLYDLFERDKEAGHPTLRREVVHRTPFAIEEAGRRLGREVVKLLSAVGDTDPTDDRFGCGSCSVQRICRLMEDGDEWDDIADALYGTGTPMWEEDMRED